MQYENGSPVPNITRAEDPYMASLYERHSAGAGDDPQLVLDRAEAVWDTANGVDQRAEAIELLMGRRVDGYEARHELPFSLSVAIFHGGVPFQAVFQEVERVLSQRNEEEPSDKSRITPTRLNLVANTHLEGTNLLMLINEVQLSTDQEGFIESHVINSLKTMLRMAVEMTPDDIARAKFEKMLEFLEDF